jgi:hypothetical protein
MRTNTGYILPITGIFSLMFLAVPVVGAQTTHGAITGALTDERGGIVAGVKLTVTQLDTGYKYATSTDSLDSYAVPSLLPGQ